MSDERLRDAYERGLPPSDGAPVLDDVAAERLRRLVEGEGTEEERLRTLDATLANAQGRRDLDIVWAASRAARPRRRSWSRYAMAASVIGIALVGGTVWMRDRNAVRTQAMRGGESPIVLVGPIGDIPATNARRFAWRPVSQGERYTLVVVDTSGTEVFATETTDTTSVLPDSVRLIPGRAYLWWVQARRRDQSTVTAVTQRLVVKAP